MAADPLDYATLPWTEVHLLADQGDQRAIQFIEGWSRDLAAPMESAESGLDLSRLLPDTGVPDEAVSDMMRATGEARAAKLEREKTSLAHLAAMRQAVERSEQLAAAAETREAVCREASERRERVMIVLTAIAAIAAVVTIVIAVA
jgi:hypothetical protein